MKDVKSPKYREITKDNWVTKSPFFVRKSSLPKFPGPIGITEPFAGPNKKKISPRKLIDDCLYLDTEKEREMKRVDPNGTLKTGFQFYDAKTVNKVDPKEFFNLVRPEAPIF